MRAQLGQKRVVRFPSLLSSPSTLKHTRSPAVNKNITSPKLGTLMVADGEPEIIQMRKIQQPNTDNV